MDFNDSTNENGLIQDITSITGATTTDYTLKERTRDINNAYSRIAYLIIQSDGRMQWDDTNHINQPISTDDLVSGQEDYNIFEAAPAALKDWLTIEQVEILNQDNLGVKLTSIDKRNVKVAWTEYRKTDGQPVVYDFNGTSMLLKPNPNYNKTDGLIIYFQRSPSFFTSTDTTKRPGFASIFHSYLSLVPSYRWARDKGLPNRDVLKRDIDEMEVAIGTHYSKRSQYEIPVLTRAKQSFK